MATPQNKPKQLPDLQLLRQKYEYRDGLLFYKSTSGKMKAGSQAGCFHPSGYRKLYCCGKVYPEHRIIWYLVTGKDPKEDLVDHINRDKLDNRIENLRCVSHRANQLNRDALGWTRRGNKYQAQMRVKGKVTSLGYFDTEEEAREMYLRTKNALLNDDINLRSN